MTRLILKTVLIVLVGSFFVSCSGVSSGRNTEYSTSLEVLRQVNRERSRRGLQTVRPDPTLSWVAGEHASGLVRSVDPTRGRPSHSAAHAGFRQRSKKAEAQGYRVVSEVVMIGYAGDLSAVAARTIRGWLQSSSHRGAILHPDRRVMGVETRLPADGRYFVVGILSNGRGR